MFLLFVKSVYIFGITNSNPFFFLVSNHIHIFNLGPSPNVPKTVTKIPEKSGMYCNDRIYLSNLSTLFLRPFTISNLHIFSLHDI